MIRALATALLALWPALASAEPVPVQSGEHPDFSRLVFRFGDVPEWRFGRVEGGYELRTGRAATAFDLSEVFRLIPKDRIAAVEQRDDGRVFLRVECDCYADAFEVDTGVVVDIRDGRAPASGRFEAPLPSLQEQSGTVSAGPGSAPRAEKETDPLEALRYDPVRTPHVWRERLAADLATVAHSDDDATAPPATPRSDPDADRTFADAQAGLLLQIARASTQGLVLADIPGGGIGADTGGPAAAGSDTRDAAGPDEPADVANPPETPVNIRVETAVDRWNTDRETGAIPPGDREGCIDPDRLDVANWGNIAEPGSSLAKVRSRIVGEFDAADPESIEALARTYIYLTFGAEAKALLNAFRAELPDTGYLVALADIMDDGRARDPQPFQGQLQCDGRSAFWALLARPLPAGRNPVATEAILGAFSELPLHLRRHLGPLAAERLLAAGDTETPSTIRNMIEQAPGDHGAGLAMIEAGIALASGEGAAAQGQLAGIVDRDGPLAPEALARLIDARIEAGDPITDRELQSVEALAFENRGTELGARLRRAALRALVHRGTFIDAAAGLEKASSPGGLTRATVAELRRELLDRAVERADTGVFLNLVLNAPSRLADSPADAATRRAIARRLLDLGLSSPARKVLSETVSIPSPEDRLLFAESHLAERRVDLATGYLAGLTDAKALQLRARAHEFAGEFAKAAAVYAEIGDKPAQSTALWRARQWADLEDPLPTEQQSAAALATRPIAEIAGTSPSEADPRGPLARNQAILTRSEEARLILGNLLDALPKP